MLGWRIICYIGVGLDSSLRIEVGRSSGGLLNTGLRMIRMLRCFDSWVLQILRKWIRGEISFFAPSFCFFKGDFCCPTAVGQLHHSCGAVAPQLWGSCTTAVGQRVWSREKQLSGWREQLLRLPEREAFGRGSYWKQGARSVILQRETIQHGVYTNAKY